MGKATGKRKGAKPKESHQITKADLKGIVKGVEMSGLNPTLCHKKESDRGTRFYTNYITDGNGNFWKDGKTHYFDKMSPDEIRQYNCENPVILLDILLPLVIKEKMIRGVLVSEYNESIVIQELRKGRLWLFSSWIFSHVVGQNAFFVRTSDKFQIEKKRNISDENLKYYTNEYVAFNFDDGMPIISPLGIDDVPPLIHGEDEYGLGAVPALIHNEDDEDDEDDIVPDLIKLE